MSQPASSIVPPKTTVVIGGTIAIDHVKTPDAEASDLLGGSAAYAALAASFFSRPIELIGITSFFPRLRSGHPLFQRPSPQNHIPSNSNRILPMSKIRLLTMMAVVTAMACFGLTGTMRAEPAPAAKPATIKSANDPTKPVPGGVRWFGRMHQDYLNQTKTKKFDLCFLGDSITQMWPGDLFAKYFGKYSSVNFGIGGDRCENVLFRLNDGELQGATPKLIVLMIGTNNQGMNTAEEVPVGIEAVVKALRIKCPQSKILLLGILPSANTPLEKTNAINAITAKLANGNMIHYQDFGSKLLDKDGKLLPGMLADAVHLNRKAYEIWGDEVSPTVAKLMEN